MLLAQNEKVHVMHRSFFEKGSGRTLIGTVEDCEAGVARIRGHIYVPDPAKNLPARQPEAVTRFIPLVNGEYILTPLPETVVLDKITYAKDERGCGSPMVRIGEFS